MKTPISWIRDYVDLPLTVTNEELAQKLTALGLKLEALEQAGGGLEGPLVIGRVRTMAAEPQKNGKIINWCSVDVGPELNAAHGSGEAESVGIVCGAHNFKPGDLVVVVLPGGVLPGGLEISARKTYGHVSTGMICSAKELGLGEDHAGIIVLPEDAGRPGDDVVELLHLREDVIEFEINPDRAYALSLRGIAREAALGFHAPYTDPADRDVPAGNDSGHPVIVEDPQGCPLFVTRTVTGFDPAAPTPRWLARRVQLAGMRPISLAVDITNYVMLELGQPIHGYDRAKLQGPIRVRRATSGERLTTLDDVERMLSVEDLLITDDRGPIGLAGVMGGASTELSETTSDIVIEAAHFDPVTIFRAQKRHKLPSEASKRFERGVDPAIAQAAADRVVHLLVEFGGGTIDEGVTVIGAPTPRTPIEMAVDLPARVSGLEIDQATVIADLRAVGCAVSVLGDRVSCIPPQWRPDLTDPYDLVEEVVRIVGYDKVPSLLPAAPAGHGLTAGQALRRRIGRTLAGTGLVEVINFPFVGPADLDALELPADDPRRRTMRLANPLSAEQPEMTTTLLPALLRTVARNVARGATDVAVFETSQVTQPTGRSAPILGVEHRPDVAEWQALQAAVPAQPLHLGLALTGNRDRAGWWGSGRPASWSDAVEIVRQIAAALGAEVEVRSASVAPWHPGRCAEVLLDGASIGYAGELHPRVCASHDLPARTCAAEIDLEPLLDAAVAVVPAPDISGFPVAKDDLALIVDADLSAATLARTLREGAGELCESVRLFDIYTGDQIADDKKSLAFTLRFRAPDRTLTEEETGRARAAAAELAARRHQAVRR